MWEYDDIAGRFLADKTTDLYSNTSDSYGSDSYYGGAEADPYGYDSYSSGGSYGKKEAEPLDYSVVSVGILTLGLILLVEIFRHHIDHAAHGRPFFQAVLENVYSELATLGMVELFVFLLLKYYEGINKERKDVFGDVHFALFYTAILNAFQSCLVAYATNRASTKLWVSTEHLELDHYVEIREAFDEVQTKVNNAGVMTKWNPFSGLRSRYLTLLVQVRFHELRLHFLEGNDLPLTLRVSDYLKKSEQRVLLKLVHISELAWLLLTGGLNLIYFLMGMIAFATSDGLFIGRCLTGIFFSMLVLFIFITIVLYFKMKKIYEEILSMKHIGDSEQHEEGLKQQRALFWLGEPRLVIAIIQFMQFGYALALAIVLMYWQDLTALSPFWYFGAVLVCYSIFVYVLSLVLPQYTLCTSLGHMVNQKNLQETVALHRLEDAQKRQRRKKAEAHYNFDNSILALGDVPDATDDKNNGSNAMLTLASESTSSLIQKENSSSSGSSTIRRQDSESALEDKKKLLAALIRSDTASLRQQLPEETREKLNNRAASVRPRRMKTLSDGVASMRALGTSFRQLDTNPSPAASTSLALDDADALKRDRDRRMAMRRANRKKTASESAVIQSWRNLSAIEETVKEDKVSVPTAERHRRKSSSTSDVNQTFFGRAKTVDDDALLAKKSTLSSNAPGRDHRRRKSSSTSDVNASFLEETKTAEGDDPSLTAPFKAETKTNDHAARIAQRRLNRKKALSESSVIKSWQDYSVKDDPKQPISDSRPKLEVFRETSKSTPVITASVVEDFGTEKLVVDPHPIEGPVPTEEVTADSSAADIAETKSIASGSIVLEFAADSDMPLKESDGNVLVAKKDDGTDDTGNSVGELSDGGLSDVEIDEEIRNSIRPPVAHSDKNWKESLVHRFSPVRIIQDAKHFFLSENYQTVSHVFGTLVIFFLIGQRVEAMIAATGIYDKSDNTWELRLNASFWWEVVWYGLFSVKDLLIMILFLPVGSKSVAEKKLLLATVIDLSLVGTCMALLFIAEMQRCCDVEVDAERFLVDEALGYELEDIPVGGTKTGNLDESEDCCPAWGSRTYGGLGHIEPFTSLIALRVLRFFVAGLLVSSRKASKPHKGEEMSSTEGTEGASGDHPHSHGHGHGHGHGMREEVGSALQLWERAISKYPDIVKEYGQFSSELFKTMLGLEIIHEPKHATSIAAGSPAHGSMLLEQQENAHTEPSKEQTIKLTAKQYDHLPAEAQGIIIAGRLGVPVKARNVVEPQPSPLSGLPTLTEGAEVHHDDEPQVNEFEVDKEQLAAEEEGDSMFIAPSARLVRSMRRCHRRLLPILTSWVTVDVAVTQFEIVYFEVTEDENEDGPTELHHLKENGRLALQATKGGKGLRLRDVAAGRKVVGHFDLADVTEVHVERDSPLADANDNGENGDNEDSSELETELPTEFWSGDSECRKEKCLSRDTRWAKTKEDRLKIKSVHGTLVLRFFSDLNEMEAHKEDVATEGLETSDLRKLVAYQWAQTIVHSCGKEQLHQPLPHYGEDAGEELQDYLEVSHYHDEEAHKHKKGHRKRHSHIPQVSNSSTHRTHQRSASDVGSSRKLSHSRSFDGGETSIAKPQKAMRRAVSSGDYDSHSGSLKVRFGDAEEGAALQNKGNGTKNLNEKIELV